MSKSATTADYERAAQEIGCEVATVRAIVAVESSGAGFDAEGRVLLRFEGHVFMRETSKRFNASHPHLSYPYSVANSRNKPHGRTAFNEAFALDKRAAMMATSFGLFQIMGFNFAACGFKSVDDFVSFNSESEGNQVVCFLRLLKSWGLQNALRQRNWAAIALKWNGASYRDNRYDARLAVAYKRFAG